MIAVTVKLKKHQRSNEYGKWYCTVNGEKKIVNNYLVRWYCESFEDALKSFDKNEIYSVTIEEEIYGPHGILLL